MKFIKTLHGGFITCDSISSLSYETRVINSKKIFRLLAGVIHAGNYCLYESEDELKCGDALYRVLDYLSDGDKVFSLEEANK